MPIDCDFLWIGFQKIDTQIIVVISMEFTDFPLIYVPIQIEKSTSISQYNMLNIL